VLGVAGAGKAPRREADRMAAFLPLVERCQSSDLIHTLRQSVSSANRAGPFLRVILRSHNGLADLKLTLSLKARLGMTDVATESIALYSSVVRTIRGGKAACGGGASWSMRDCTTALLK